jgi:Fe-S cluster biogenesis protein NfuA
MALMANEGAFGPLPDYAIFADTGWEPKKVYEHLEWLKTQLKYPVIICKNHLKSGSIKEDIVNEISKEKGFLHIPFFAKNTDTGKIGIGPRQCTRNYKITPINRKIRHLIGLKDRQRFPRSIWVEVWVGISTDEAMRMKPSREKWIKNIWPLIDKNMSRQACLDWYDGKNYRTPAKSSCIGCPYHDNTLWNEIKKESPEEFEEACKIDDMMRHSANNKNIERYLHRRAEPLRSIDFDKLLQKKKKDDQLDLFNNECEGMCGV